MKKLLLLLGLIAVVLVAGCVQEDIIDENQTTEQKVKNITEEISDPFGDNPVLGNQNAPITIVEFSDYQCSFCTRFWRETLPQLKENYIDTGKVKLVYRDFPLSSIHPSAQKAAEAAECADDQGKYWEYHDILFENQNTWASGDSVAEFKSYASQLGLNTQNFNQCLDSGKYTQEVRNDIQDGINLGVTGTPTFFILDKNGNVVEKIVGAQPFSVFKHTIDQTR